MNEKLSLLSNVLGRYYESSGEYLFKCPYCNHHKNKFSVNIDKGVYKCWICDQRGSNLYRIFRRFGTFNDQQRWKSISGKTQDLSEFADIFGENNNTDLLKASIELPNGFTTLTKAPHQKSGKAALRYLEKRGITESDILRWKIGYSIKYPFEDRIIIPSFDSSGDLNYFIARSFSNNPYRYKNPKVSRDIIFNELYTDFEKEIVIVEGVFDAMKCENAIPILGSTIRETSKLFRKIVKHDTPVLLALDPDAVHKTQSIKKLLMKYGIEVREMTYSDDRDLGDMTKEEVQKMTNEAKYVKSYDSLINAITAI